MDPELLPAAIIARKRDGGELSPRQIRAFIRGATEGEGAWPDYQLAALLMAVVLRGMTRGETVELTRSVMASGTVADLARIGRPKVDKHSTGGVGDKVSLILAPMVAACGAAVPMISGRGLGHTGGTLDKLESIPGFRVDLSLAEYAAQIERIGLAVIGQTAELAPADRRLYALRDVTATVESVPLICASILGKKLAEGIDFLILDVKFGEGAFMPDLARARELAETLVQVGQGLGKPVRALLTSMEQPLGRSVGNAVEVAEAILCLEGDGPADLMAVTYALGEQMLLVTGLAANAPAARDKLEAAVRSGAARKIFAHLVSAQGGDPQAVADPTRLPQAPVQRPVLAAAAGFVEQVRARAVAIAALHLGAGRRAAADEVDHAVGITHLVKVGERVEAGQRIATVHARTGEHADAAEDALRAAIALADRPPALVPLIAGIVSPE